MLTLFLKVCMTNAVESYELILTSSPLFNFLGERKEANGVISLPITWGENTKQFTIMVDFIMVDAPNT